MPRQGLVFVGTYTQPIRFATGDIVQGKGRGIHVYRLDGATGALEECDVKRDVPNPSYLALDPSLRFLYAVNELQNFEGGEGGAVSAFALGPALGQLRFLNTKLTRGADPCHLAVHPKGRHLVVANRSGGSVTVLPVGPDGCLGDPSDVVQLHGSSVHPTREAAPHPQAVAFDPRGRHVFVCDLGLDRVIIYRFDTEQGKLSPHDTPWAEIPAGSGPRQIVFHPRGEFAYVVNELSSTITAFRYDAGRGTLRQIQTAPTVSVEYRGENSGADLQISPGGEWLYALNRGHDSIAVYAIDRRSGALTQAGHEGCGGQTPRNIAVDPEGGYIVVANRDSENIVAFRNDTATGRLGIVGQAAAPTPVCVKVL